MTADRIVDRRIYAREQPVKAERWPRTDRRQRRVETVLRQRQPDLTVVLENVHDPHNVSAIVRSCDAAGVVDVHLVYTIELPPARALARTTSGSAVKWVDVQRHDSVGACYAILRDRGFAILAAALSERSRNLYDHDLRLPTALVFGNEMRGLSEESISQADGLVEIPMMGMIQSLNVSVACGVALFEALRQRRDAGDYDRAKLSASELESRAAEWLNR